ncbi:T9SS type A sorting domain-containing protein [Candidatus Poribacteria bacterium]|nr:T9SS type A sorting domain-containing protein [Candidatus Poribacteria bacterium]MYI93770.1 T9SS type A sorting domain-containing protein [Candidatus Poribacteria bacterium]
MNHSIKATSILLLCLILCLAWHIPAQASPEPVPVLISESPIPHYIYETITVPGVDFLEITSSNDHGHYVGNTMSDDGRLIGFTLIDGVFTTYDVPNSLQTAFYGFNNAGQAAGFYDDQNEISHGIILQDGEIQTWNFPGALNTQIFGIGEEGQILGDVIDANDNVNGFIDSMPFDIPGAATTYVDHINAAGIVVGSYVDSDGKPHGFFGYQDGTFTDIGLPGMPNIEYLFVNAINDAGVIVFRAKIVDDIERSYVLHPNSTPLELRFPGSVGTVLRDIDTEGRVVGYYDLPDGRRQGCVITPVSQKQAEKHSNVFTTDLTKGLNMLSLPLATPKPMNAKAFAGLTGSTMVIALDAENQRFIGWTPDAPDDGFQIEGGQGYIVNVPQQRDVIFVGAEWRNETEAAAAPSATPIAIQQQTWAFIVSGHLGSKQKYDGYHITVTNLRTHDVMTTQVQDNYFAAATADLSYRSVVQVGDTMQVIVTDSKGNIASDAFTFEVTPASVAEAFLSVTLDSIGTPKHSELLQNYPNPFNPETWIPYRLSEDSNVSITIYNATGNVVQTLSLGFQSAGFYQDRGRAAYWDGKNASGEKVASGLYFYQLTTKSFQQTRRLIVVK